MPPLEASNIIASGPEWNNLAEAQAKDFKIEVKHTLKNFE